MNATKVVGLVLIGYLVLNWGSILTPLTFFSMPPRFSVPLILGLFPVWLLVLLASIKCFSKPSAPFKLIAVALFITITAATFGFVINRDLSFVKIFIIQTGVLLGALATLYFSKKGITHHSSGTPNGAPLLKR